MTKLKKTLLLLFILSVCSVAPLNTVSAQAQPARDVTPDALIAAVNDLRLSQKLAPYQTDAALMAYAQEHAAYQARLGFSTHYHADGSFAQQLGLLENLAYGDIGFLSASTILEAVWTDPGYQRTLTGYPTGSIGAGVAANTTTLFVALNVRPYANPGDTTPTPSPTTPYTNPNAAPTQVVNPASPLATSTPNKDGSIIHYVKYGETLWGIAVAYGVSMDVIRAQNGLAAASISIFEGQKLIIRLPGKVTATATVPETPIPSLVISTATHHPTRTPGPTSTPVPTRSPTRAPLINLAPLGEKLEGSLFTPRFLGLLLVLVCIGGLAYYGIGLVRK